VLSLVRSLQQAVTHEDRQGEHLSGSLTRPAHLYSRRTPGLHRIVPEALQKGHHFGVLPPLRRPNHIAFPFPRFTQIHLPARGDPPLDYITVAFKSNSPGGRASIFSRLVDLDPGIFQQQTDTVSLSKLAGHHEGSAPIVVLLIDVNARVAQEDGDKGVMAFLTGMVEAGPGIPVPPVDIECGFFLRISFTCDTFPALDAS